MSGVRHPGKPAGRPMDLASKLDTRVRIERKTVTPDPAYGTQEASWSVFANVWG